MKNLISASILGISTVSLILAGVAVPASASPNLALTDQVSTVTDVNAAAKTELLQRINNHRLENGLKPLVINPNLETVAQDWTNKTTAAGGFKHNPSFDSQIPPNWKYAAEIIAAGDGPEDMMFGWINSEGHNTVMLETTATEIGIGYAYQGNPAGEYYGNYYATAILANYGSVTPIKKDVTPVAPTWNTTTFDIPAVTGIQYRVNGIIKPAGSYPGMATTTVTAEALDGYAITGTASWTKNYEIVVIDPSPSVILVTPEAPSFTDTNYTIPAINGVQYKVNGVVRTAGTYPGNGTIGITAEALEGFALAGTVSWNKTYSTVVTGPLPTVKTVSPAVPTFSATQYTIPATEGVQYKANGTAKAAGSYPGVGTVTITATALPGYQLSGISSWSKTFIPLQPTPAIRALGDIVAIDASGNLWNYGLLNISRKKIGAGWQSFNDIHTADWNKDGLIDIIAKNDAGEIYLFKATSSGSFVKTKLGSGWKNYTLDVVHWNKKLKYPSIIATNVTTGKLYHYANLNGSGISPQVLISSGGWRGIAINAIDWDKDGNMDLIVKNSIGQLVLYRTNGAGQFINERRAVIGTGWNAFDSIKVVKSFGGIGTTGLMVRNSAGNLVYYQANKSSWAKAKVLSSGWKPYKIANQ